MNKEPLPPDTDTRLRNLDSMGVTPSRAGGGSKSPAMWEPPTPEELQKQIPAYKILDTLGRGGMGAVYKGWQTSLDRYVAVKILPPEAEDDEAQFAARFKQEAKTMARFQHPGIVSVYDAGETASGLLYIVMEFVEGTDVSQMVKSQGRLPAAHALAITAHVCDALQYAHTHGVVHRDIKPANIMVNTEGAVKVADFGLAKSRDIVQGSAVTKTNMTLGTPDYVAPEALVIGMEADHRADLYAMGVMLFNMLTGEIPRGIFKLPSHKLGTDPRFDSIITKAMEQNRDERYQSAADLRHDLDVILSTPIAKAEPPQSAPKPQKPAAPAPQPRASHTPVEPLKKSGAGKAIAAIAVVAAIAVGAFVMMKKPASPVQPVSSDTFIREVAALPAEQQVQRVMAKMKELNSGFDPATANEKHEITNGRVTSLDFAALKVMDISPIRALASLTHLSCGGTGGTDSQSSPLSELSPLRGLPLTELNVYNAKVRDLSSLKGMRLTQLHVNRTLVEDLSPLAGMQLERMSCYQTQVSDLAPLKGMPLKELTIDSCPVSDLSALKGIPLERFSARGTPAADLSPLKGKRLFTLITGENIRDYSVLRGMPLISISGSMDRDRDRDILSSIPTLKMINGKPAAEWLRNPTPGTPSVAGNGGASPTAALTFAGHRYLFFPEALGWDQAKAKAESLGGHLATITSKAENDWIAETFVKKLPLNRGLWLGASSPAGKDKASWKWLTGEPFAFTDWKPNRPENTGEVALMFSWSNGGIGWTDMFLRGTGATDWRGGFLVEWDDEGKSSLGVAGTPREVPADGSWLDVIPLVQLPRDMSMADTAKPGTGWRVVTGALQTGDSGNATIISPELTMPESYDLSFRVNASWKAVFTSAAVQLPVGGNHLMAYLSLRKTEADSLTGLEMIDGKSATESTYAIHPSLFSENSDHLVEVSVRNQGGNASVTVKLDGKQILKWAGKEEAVSLWPSWRRIPLHRFGLSAHYASITYSDVRVRRVDSGFAAAPATTAPAAGDVRTLNGHRYQLVLDKALAWSDAKAKAEKMGGHLATITSKEEDDFVRTNFCPATKAAGQGYSFWLGGRQETTSSEWNWITGEPFKFTGWGKGEPNGRPGQGTPNAIAYAYGAGSYDGGFGWNDLPPKEDSLWGQKNSLGYLVEWEDDGKAMPPPDPRLTLLLTQYAKATQDRLATATAADKPAFTAELARLKNNEPLPASDDPKLPAELLRLRTTLRGQIEKLK